MNRLAASTFICALDILLLIEMAVMYVPGGGPTNRQRLVVWTGAVLATFVGLKWSIFEYRKTENPYALILVGGGSFLFLALTASIAYLIWFMANNG